MKLQKLKLKNKEDVDKKNGVAPSLNVWENRDKINEIIDAHNKEPQFRCKYCGSPTYYHDFHISCKMMNNKEPELKKCDHDYKEVKARKCCFKCGDIKSIEPKKWKPVKGEKYWFINNDGEIDNFKWADDLYDNKVYKFGNCFPIEEQAIRARDKIKELLNKEYETNKRNKGL